MHLPKIAWTICSTHNTTLKHSPGHLMFYRNIIIQLQRLINWNLIRSNKHSITILNNLQENNKQLEWNYKLGNKVLLDYAQ